MKHFALFLLTFCACSVSQAQVQAFMKLWDNKHQFPEINEIEFKGNVPPLDTYNAIYGHGAMMENEWWGLRVYMDHRQSIDLYGKYRKELELHRTNFYSTREDMAAGLGCDILWAGQSVGAGSFRGYVDGKTTYVDSVAARGQRVVQQGPDTAVVEVWDRDWLYNGHPIQMRQRYTMIRGHRELLVDIWLEGETDDDLFATGVQKLEMDNQGSINRKKGIVKSRGKNVPDKNAPDLIEGLSMEVQVPKQYIHQMKEDDLNYLCILRPVNHHIQYTLKVWSDKEK